MDDGQPPAMALQQRVERTRRVVSACSQIIIRAYEEQALLLEECRLLIDVGQYAMVWIGETTYGETRIKALAHAASDSGVRTVQPWETETSALSPTLRAIREQRPQVVRGIPNDPMLRQRYPEAEKAGYASLCAFPIQLGARGIGALTIYAREPEAFAPEEVALLRELAGDMAVGVAALRAKQANDLLEEQLASAERRFRNLIDNAPVAVLQVNLEGRVLIANQTLAEMLGYATPAEILSQTTQHLSRHLDDADRERLQKVILAGPPFKPVEVRAHRRDGSRLWVDVQVQPGLGIGERVIEAFVRDLTSVRAAQLASARLAAVVNSSDEAIIGIDASAVVRNWSWGAAALYGCTEEEVVGRPLIDVYVPDDRRDECTGLLDALAQGRRVHRFETRRVAKDGSVKEVSVAASPILDSEGTFLGASFIEHDVSERNRAQLARAVQERQQQEVFNLQELTRLRAEFMGRASHELNTPLTPVLLHVQALKGSPGLDAKQVMSLASIERNVLRLAVLVKDLMVASTLNTSHLELNPARMDLGELVTDAVETFRAQAEKAGVDLKVPSGATAPAFADRDRVLQVLYNLIGNAIKFTPRGGSVTIDTEQREAMAKVIVRDTGLGYAKEAQANLFRPFGRLHEDIPGTAPGTGLGLFISKGIVEESGGEIWARSPGPGKGCTVGFTLPREAPPRPGRGIRSALGFHAGATDGIEAAPGQDVDPIVSFKAEPATPPSGAAQADVGRTLSK